MSATDLARIASFRASFARRQAAETTEIPGGVVVVDHQYSASYVNNQVVIDGAQRPSDLLALADTALGFLPYRRITFLDDAAGQSSASALIAAGYAHETELIMSRHATADTPAEPATPTMSAQPVTLEELRPALILQQRIWMPDAEDAVVGQLADRRAARLRGAPQVTFLAARDGDGVIASSADLYLDPAHDIAQIEDLVTADTHLHQGYADAVLTTALQQAATCELLFLIADSTDWPRTWYARRGFTAIGHSHVFTRTPTLNGADEASD